MDDLLTTSPCIGLTIRELSHTEDYSSLSPLGSVLENPLKGVSRQSSRHNSTHQTNRLPNDTMVTSIDNMTSTGSSGTSTEGSLTSDETSSSLSDKLVTSDKNSTSTSTSSEDSHETSGLMLPPASPLRRPISLHTHTDKCVVSGDDKSLLSWRPVTCIGTDVNGLIRCVRHIQVATTPETCV